MVVSESVARPDVFKEIFAIIDTNKLSGWKILSAFPEKKPVFPCVIINPVNLDKSSVTLNRTNKLSEFELRIELFALAKDGLKKVDEGKDNIDNTFSSSTNIEALIALNIDVKDITDLATDQQLINGSKLNSSEIKLSGSLLF